jgi:hypothetical protein
MTAPKLLVVDDEDLVRWSLGERIRHRGRCTTRASAARPFMVVTCSAVLETLLESEFLRPRARRLSSAAASRELA